MSEAGYFSRQGKAAEQEYLGKRAPFPGPSYPFYRTYATTHYNDSKYDIMDPGPITSGNSEATMLLGDRKLPPSPTHGQVDFWSRSKRPLARLCAYCQNIFDQWFEIFAARESNEGSIFPHYESIDDLEASSEAGCDICYQLMISCHLADHSNHVDSGILTVPCGLKEEKSSWRFELYQQYDEPSQNITNGEESDGSYRWFFYVDLQMAHSEGL